MSHTALGIARIAVIQQHTRFLPCPSLMFLFRFRNINVQWFLGDEHCRTSLCFYWWMLRTMPGKPCLAVCQKPQEETVPPLYWHCSHSWGARRKPHTCPSHWPAACHSEWNIFQRNRKQMFDVSVADVQGTHWPYAGVKASPSPLCRKCIVVRFPCGFIWVCKSSVYSAPISTL